MRRVVPCREETKTMARQAGRQEGWYSGLMFWHFGCKDKMPKIQLKGKFTYKQNKFSTIKQIT